MSTLVAKGAELRTTWSLYVPAATPTQLADPDEFPVGPRFKVKDSGGNVVDGFTDLPYSRHLGLGVFSLNLPIPLGDLLEPDDYTLEIEKATKDGQALVLRSGAAPTFPFTIAAAPERYAGDRPYATPEELEQTYGVDPKPTAKEVAFAQQLLDDKMHRSLWPTVVERERQAVPPDRNLIKLDVKPVIRIYSAEVTDPVDAHGALGRYGYGRRDRRQLNNVSSDYLAVTAVFGSPPRFTAINAADIQFHAETGELWLPTGFFLINYTQVEITYEAGLLTIPPAMKWAIAETIAWVRLKGFGPLSQWSLGRVSQSTGESLITPEVLRRIDKWIVRSYR